MSAARRCDVCGEYSTGTDGWWRVSDDFFGTYLFPPKTETRFDVCSLDCLASLALDLSANVTPGAFA